MSMSPAASAGEAAGSGSGKAGPLLARLDPRVYNLLLLFTQAAAFWPLWEWYASRIIQYPENRVGLLALVAVLVIASTDGQKSVRRAGLLLPLACLLIYSLLHPFVHPLVTSLLAAVCLGYTAGYFVSPTRRAPIVGLLLLALPVIPAMQTWVGYPLRVVVAELAVPFARMAGVVETVREGVGLRWSGGLILVDEPCSGIRMLWTGYFLTFAMAGMLGLSMFRTAALCVITLTLIAAGNLLRALALFIAEVRLPAEYFTQHHETAGLVTFTLAGAGIIGAAFWLAQRQRPQ